MRTAAIAGSLACAGALAVYPLTLSPGHPLGPWLAAAVLVATGAAAVIRSHLLAAAAGVLVVSSYALRLLLGDPSSGVFIATVGVGLLVLLELLDLATTSPPGTVERAVARRRAGWIAATAFTGGIVALSAHVLGGAFDARHPLLFVFSTACAAGALALVTSLTRGALARRDARPPPA